MAIMETWQRTVLPDARVVVPSGENPIAEQFGKGLHDIGDAGTKLAFDLQRADQLREEREFQTDLPKVSKEIAQAGIDFAIFYADAKAKAPADLAGLQGEVDKWWDDRRAAIAATTTNQRALDYLDLHALELKGKGIAEAVKDTTAATLQARGNDIQAVVKTEVSRVTADPGAYASAMANTSAALDALKGPIQAATLDEWRTRSRQAITSAMIGGEVSRDPEQALAWLNSGDYDGDLDPKEKAQLVGQAKALSELKKTQAVAARANQAIGLKVKVDHAVDLFKSGLDFAGFDELAGELKAADQVELLRTLTTAKQDLDYARTALQLAPAALQAEYERNMAGAEHTADAVEADTYLRHAEIAEKSFETVSAGLAKDPLGFAVAAKLVAETDLLSPLLSGDGDGLSEALQARQTARAQTRNYYGVPVSLLMPNERQALVTAFNDLPTADAKAALLSRIVGLKDGAGVEIANELKSLAGGQDIPMYLSFLSDDASLGYDIIKGGHLLTRDKKLLPDTGVFDREVRHRVGNLMADKKEQQLALIQGITDYYAALVNAKGGADGDGVDIALLNKAFERVTGGAFLYDNGNNPPQVIIPPRPGMTESQFDHLILTIDDDMLVRQSARAALGSGSDPRRQRGPVFGNGRPVTARDIQDEGNFVWVGPGLYNVLINGAPVRDGQTGGIFVLDLEAPARQAQQ